MPPQTNNDQSQADQGATQTEQATTNEDTRDYARDVSLDGAGGDILPPEDIEKTLRFDFFAEGPSEDPTQEAGAEDAGEGAEAGTGEEGSEEGAEGAGSEPAPGVDQAGSEGQQQQPDATKVENELLKGQIKTLMEQLGQTRGTGQKPGQQGGKEQPKEEPLPPYDFDVPDALVAAIADEDPMKRRAGMAAMMKGLATAVHQQMRAETVQRFQQFAPYVGKQMEQMLAVHTYQQSVRDDFYGTYPEFRAVPGIETFVQRVGQDVVKELGTNAWTPQVRDSIAKRLKGLGIGVAQPAGGQQRQAPPNNNRRPANLRSTSPGPRQAPAMNEQQRHMMDLFDG